MPIFLSSPCWKRRTWQRGRRTVPGLKQQSGTFRLVRLKVRTNNEVEVLIGHALDVRN
jgi:hypothetical protein